MNREILTLIAVALLSALAGIAVFHLSTPDAEIVSAKSNGAVKQLRFEDLAFTDLDGRRRKLSDWSEQLLVINFWAPWCAPCRREIPALIELQENHQDRLRVVGLAFDRPDNIRQFISSYPFNYPLLPVLDNSAAVNRFFGNTSGGLPFTAILDENRKIVFRHAGEISLNSLENVINQY